MRLAKSTAWLILTTVVAAGGASCPTRQPPVVMAPVAFTAPPTLTDVLRVVNTNSTPIRQLQADNARLSIDGLPALRASVAIDRPRNFRLRAQFVGVGEVLDLGSNQEVFWALVDAPQVATNVPKAIYYARHDQYQSSHARDLLPIKPDWLIDAFGFPSFDPNLVHEGPWQRGAEQLEFRSRIPTPEGEVGRITVVHATYGWILEQHLYDPRGEWAASALSSDHRYYPSVGVSLPHRVEIRLPPPNRSFHLEIESYSINQLRVDPSQLFAMPNYPGYPLVDLATINSMPPTSVPPGQTLGSPPQNIPPDRGYPATGYRPRYRGYNADRR